MMEMLCRVRDRATRATRATRVLGLLVLCGSTAAAQAGHDPVDWPLASREALVAFAADPTTGRARATEARRRLEHGDLRAGDLILLEVYDEPMLTDTFAVSPEITLRLPPPVGREVPLRGVLRVELEEHLRAQLARFVRTPFVRARPLIRLALEGEVARAGFYAVPADARLADVLMTAGGVTAAGDLRKLRLTRAGRTLFDGARARDAVATGWTVDDARLRDGDAIIVGRGRGDLEGRLRFLWLTVSLAGGLYGLSQLF
jgi:protein involved in polysaccharide export with SLBB domain